MKKPNHIVLIFIDGLGLGLNRPDINPCLDPDLRYFRRAHVSEPLGPDGIDWVVLGADATLGVSGLPQSATGQTALLTGVNAPRMLQRHLSGFPNQRLRAVIEEKSILKQLCERGCRAAFLNTFRPPFFDFDPQDIIRHLSATTLTTLYAGLAFFALDDLVHKRSIYQDMTNESLRARGFDVPVFTPEEAGQILAQQSIE